MKESLRNKVGGALGGVWRYLGSLAALCVLLGVLGMAAFHVWKGEGESVPFRYFSGLLNYAGAEVPEGVGELPRAVKFSEVPHVRLEYGKDGRLTGCCYIGPGGVPATFPGSEVAVQRLSYDKSGHLLRKQNLGPSGKPAADSAGVARRDFSYDPAGRLTQVAFFGADGAPVQPRHPGYARKTISYDNHGRLHQEAYFDTAGHPVVNSAGECRVQYEYDSDTHTTLRTNYINDKPALNVAGFAQEKLTRSPDGRRSHIQWLGVNGEPVLHAQHACAAVLEEHHDGGALIRRRFCGTDGDMREQGAVCAEHVRRVTPDGRTEWECYHTADGQPCNHPLLGYAERICEYGPDGKLVREFFRGANGEPAVCCERRYTRDARGPYVLSLRADGSTEVQRLAHTPASTPPSRP